MLYFFFLHLSQKREKKQFERFYLKKNIEMKKEWKKLLLATDVLKLNEMEKYHGIFLSIQSFRDVFNGF